MSFLVLQSTSWEKVSTCIALWRHVTVSILCLFLVAPWVGLQCAIVAFPGHIFTHLLFGPGT